MVRINGVIIKQLGFRCDAEDSVELTGRAVREQEQKISVAFHKPLGIVSSQPEAGYTPAISLLTASNQWKQDKTRRGSAERLKKLAVCGRLDINSTGLLLFTQDGALAKALLSKHPPIHKEYLVRVKETLQHPTTLQLTPTAANALKILSSPVSCSGDILTLKSADVINPNQLRIVLLDGKHHHIRRMCQAAGLHVSAIKRVRIGKLALNSLPLGQWRFVDAQQII